MEKQEIHYHAKFFPSNQFRVNLVKVNLTEFLRKNRARGSKIRSMEKRGILSQQKNRQINSLVTYLVKPVKPLLSRNFG